MAAQERSTKRPATRSRGLHCASDHLRDRAPTRESVDARAGIEPQLVGYMSKVGECLYGSGFEPKRLSDLPYCYTFIAGTPFAQRLCSKAKAGAPCMTASILVLPD